MSQDEYREMEIAPPSAIESLEKASINMQVATAKTYPRGDLKKIRTLIESAATMDEDTAEACFYKLRRKQKDEETGEYVVKTIMGPSVRLAEIALSYYKNVRAGARPIDNNGKFITAQGICHDLENNILVSVEVTRRITNRNGKTFSDDMQTVVANAACAIALRNAVFKVIPGALVEPVFEKCKRVAMGTAATLKDKRDKYLKRLAELGVDQARVLHALGRESVEGITLVDLEDLIGMANSIKEGTSIDEVFPPIQNQRAGSQEAADKMRDEKLKTEQAANGATGTPTQYQVMLYVGGTDGDFLLHELKDHPAVTDKDAILAYCRNSLAGNKDGKTYVVVQLPGREMIERFDPAPAESSTTQTGQQSSDQSGKQGDGLFGSQSSAGSGPQAVPGTGTGRQRNYGRGQQ